VFLRTNKQHHQIAMMLKYFGFIMAIFYFVMGIGILVLPYFDTVTDSARYLVAAMLLAYGIIRFIRKLKEKTHEEQEP
jgi:uncharacterized membrane protein HdeD (DUF308 family)